MARVGRQPRRGEGGFGLLEVIMSLTVLLLVLVASSFLVDTVVKQAAFNREKVAAAELAEQYLEITSNATLSSLQANISRNVLLTANPISVGGIDYSVWSHLEWAGTGNTPSLCTSGNPPQVIRATMTVKWGNGQSMGETSIIEPPYGTIIPGDGFLSIKIVGADPTKPPADTTNLINVVVNVTPQSTGVTTAYNPDQNGCVYLQEPVGKYNISLAGPSGGPSYIDWLELANPSATSVNVATAGLPAFAPTFHFDESGTVTLSPSAGAPVAAGMPITVANGASSFPSGINTVVPYGSNTTVVPLFPFTAPYTVWYGDCVTVLSVTKEQPDAPTPFSLSPQGAESVPITGLNTLAITATRTAGAAFSATPTATATINDAAAPGDGCPSADKTGGEVFTLAGATPTTVGSTTSYTTQTAIMNQTYTVVVNDPSNNSNTSFSMVMGTTGVTYNGTLYPYGTSVPVVVT